MKQFAIVRKMKNNDMYYIDTLKEDEVYDEYLKRAKTCFLDENLFLIEYEVKISTCLQNANDIKII